MRVMMYIYQSKLARKMALKKSKSKRSFSKMPFFEMLLQDIAISPKIFYYIDTMYALYLYNLIIVGCRDIIFIVQLATRKGGFLLLNNQIGRFSLVSSPVNPKNWLRSIVYKSKIGGSVLLPTTTDPDLYIILSAKLRNL